MRPIKVLIVDDSALIRKTLTEIFGADPDLEVVAAVQDPYFARDAIKKYRPDVITLDIEMPRMDGITFLEKLMRHRPMPVVVVSSLAEEKADVTIEALELGAVTCIEKPKLNLEKNIRGQAVELVETVKAASRSRVSGTPRASAPTEKKPTVVEKHSVDDVLPARSTRNFATSDRVVAIGASTGGTNVLRDIVSAMPLDCPGIVMVQHMPGGFTASLAATLNRNSAIEVREAKDGDRILPGLALLAPSGTHHTVIRRSGANYHVRLIEGPRVDRHIPSVNVLFRSMAQEVGPNGVGVILTGMGDDGADGLCEMRTSGAVTMAQDEATSTVFGMPREAIERGGAQHVVGRPKLAHNILRYANTKTRV